MFQKIPFASRPAGLIMLMGVIFGSYSGTEALGTDLFISTHGASGDTHTLAGEGDDYTRAGSGDTFTTGGMGEQ